jgi:NADP-dependent 3-hydroxy acid dehydrogenase YdfG
MKYLRNGVAIITDASHGIGLYIVRTFVNERINLFLAAQSTDNFDQFATKITALDVQALPV